MSKRGPRSLTRRNVVAAAALMAWFVAGCGTDGPTRPTAASVSDLFGSQLYRADGRSVGVGVLDNTSIIGIYFADPGCPACTSFTPILVDTYNQLKNDGRSFEVVLVALGINNQSLFEYMEDSEMPWLAVLPQSGRGNALAQRYGIQWIPTLVIVDRATNTISLAGREEVTQDGAAAYDAWLAASGGS
jgi:hypothetical protein